MWPDDEQGSEDSPLRGGTNGASNGNGAGHPDLDAAPLVEGAQGVSLPAHSTRSAVPGRGGCWALSKRGDPCNAPRRGDSDYCNAHSGIGVAADPKGHSAVGIARSAENRRRRAEIRLAIGMTRNNTPRGVLKGLAYVNAERVAGRVLDAVLDPRTPSVSAARLGLDLINVVDPPLQATLTSPVPTDPDGVAKLSLSQLLTLGEQMGIDPSPIESTGS